MCPLRESMEDWTNANERQDSAHRAGLFCPASCTFAFTAEVVEAAACPSLLVLPIIVFDLTNSGNLSGFITLWLTPYAIGWLVVILLVYGVTTVVQSRKQISGSNVEDVRPDHGQAGQRYARQDRISPPPQVRLPPPNTQPHRRRRASTTGTEGRSLRGRG